VSLCVCIVACSDFTINSLFYNLNEGVVEDYTGKGLDDLGQGMLRTPLPPLQTFLDGE
jgi:tRNA nucleotidyltransferase (CCA-adding enzyme)